MKISPLLHGQQTGTDLDAITNKLYFIYKLSDKQINWLNTIIYSDKYFHINYWSLTHTFFGMAWGFLKKYNNKFNILNFVIFHTLFEIWELWAFGYQNIQDVDVKEWIDIVMDTIFGLIGVCIMI